MGYSYDYRCPDCGYKTMASIGSGMMDTDGLEIALCSCPDCGSMKEVRTKVIWDFDKETLEDIPRYKDIQICSECGSRMRYVDYWLKDGERKCPKCGKMNCTWEMIGLWD